MVEIEAHFLPRPSFSLLINIRSKVADSGSEPLLSEEHQKETDGQTAVEHSCSPVRQRQAGVGVLTAVFICGRSDHLCFRPVSCLLPEP